VHLAVILRFAPSHVPDELRPHPSSHVATAIIHNLRGAPLRSGGSATDSDITGKCDCARIGSVA
jgi:hypothetical protein